MNKKDPKSIILFDGICNLCNGAVQFILKRDKKERFLFASLQSDAAKNVLLQYNVKKMMMDSIILIEEGEVFDKSTAVLRICRHLNGLWPVFYPTVYLPKKMRDLLYDHIARKRYTWFGVKDHCTMMLPEYKNRFIY